MAAETSEREKIYDLFEKAVKDYLCKWRVSLLHAAMLGEPLQKKEVWRASSQREVVLGRPSSCPACRTRSLWLLPRS